MTFGMYDNADVRSCQISCVRSEVPQPRPIEAEMGSAGTPQPSEIVEQFFPTSGR